MGAGSPGDPDGAIGRKRKREGTTVNLRDFLGSFVEDTAIANNETYIHIKSADNVPIARRNRFLVAKYLKSVSQNITKASFNGKGEMILKVKGEKDVEKILKLQQIGEWPVKVERHQTLNSSKGIVFNPDLSWLSEEEIKEGLAEYKVKEVYIFKRTPRNAEVGTNREAKPYGLIILTFDTQQPPKKIRYGFEYIEVRKYIPNPMRCKKCQRLGHTTGNCQSKRIVCEQCGQGFEEERVPVHNCSNKMCVNCTKTGHTSNDRDCPQYLMAKKVESIMALENLSRYEARKAFFNRYQSIEGYLFSVGKNFAQVVASTYKESTESIRAPTPNKTTEGDRRVNNDNSKEEENTRRGTPKVNIEAKKTKTKEAENPQEKQEVEKQNANTEGNIGKVNARDLENKSIVNSNNNLKSSIKLRNWKLEPGKGITYFLNSKICNGKKPEIDFSKFKGKKKEIHKDILNHANRCINNDEMLNQIVEEVGKKSNCNRIIIRIVQGKATIMALNEEEDSSSDESMSLGEEEF